MTGTLVAVCAVHTLHDGHSSAGATAIDKRPLPGPVRIDLNGVAGDTQIDVRHHGGPDQALYAYAREEAERWSDELGIEIPPGLFGENLAVRGMPVTDAVVGERWRIGSTVVVETTIPRMPCRTFQSWLEQPHWVKRFTQRGDVGTYLRVLTPGRVQAGDPVEVVLRPAHGFTIRQLLTVDEQDPQQLRRVLHESGDLAEKAARRIHRALDAVARTS